MEKRQREYRKDRERQYKMQNVQKQQKIGSECVKRERESVREIQRNGDRQRDVDISRERGLKDRRGWISKDRKARDKQREKERKKWKSVRENESLFGIRKNVIKQNIGSHKSKRLGPLKASLGKKKH